MSELFFKILHIMQLMQPNTFLQQWVDVQWGESEWDNTVDPLSHPYQTGGYSLHLVESYDFDQANPQEAWYKKAGKTSKEIASLKVAWSAVKNEPYYAAFESLLRRLGNNVLKESVFPSDVVDIIVEVLESPSIRRQIFEMAQSADGDCHDRPLTIFNTIQSLARFSKLQREGASIAEIFSLADGMLKTALLDEVTFPLMTAQWKEGRRSANELGNGPNATEALEVQLALRHELGKTLNLPFKVNKPLYASIAGLTEQDKNLAIEYVKNTMDDLSKKMEAFIAMPMFLSYSQKMYDIEIKEIEARYAPLQEKLEDEALQGQWSSEVYNERCRQLVKDREAEINQLLMRKVETLYSRQAFYSKHAFSSKEGAVTPDLSKTFSLNSWFQHSGIKRVLQTIFPIFVIYFAYFYLPINPGSCVKI